MKIAGLVAVSPFRDQSRPSSFVEALSKLSWEGGYIAYCFNLCTNVRGRKEKEKKKEIKKLNKLLHKTDTKSCLLFYFSRNFRDGGRIGGKKCGNIGEKREKKENTRIHVLLTAKIKKKKYHSRTCIYIYIYNFVPSNILT